MKTVSVNIDWLNIIDGLSVTDAIKYLSNLPGDHVLNYWQSSGKVHGVEISSDLSYKRPYTKEELEAEAVQRKIREIKDVENFIAFYEKKRDWFQQTGKQLSADCYQRDIEMMQAKLEELQNPNVNIGA